MCMLLFSILKLLSAQFQELGKGVNERMLLLQMNSNKWNGGWRQFGMSESLFLALLSICGWFHRCVSDTFHFWMSCPIKQWTTRLDRRETYPALAQMWSDLGALGVLAGPLTIFWGHLGPRVTYRWLLACPVGLEVMIWGTCCVGAPPRLGWLLDLWGPRQPCFHSLSEIQPF